jgi:putative heme-binding domain-containing protein
MRVLLLSFAAVLAAQLQAQSPGRKLFEAQCALCHGQNGGGGRGPTLLTPKLNRAPDAASLERVIANGIDPEMPGAWQLSPNEVKQLATYVLSLGKVAQEIVPGNAEHGRAVYARQGCPSCHLIDGSGSGYGPELSAIGARRNAAHLRQSIAEPAAALADGFLMMEATPVAGTPVTGIRLGEDPFTVQLASATGKLFSFRKAELRQLKPLPGRTPMPAYKLTAGDLQDLVAYLAARKGKP